MPRYVVLVNWTEQGVRNAKQIIERLTRLTKQFKASAASFCQSTIRWAVTTWSSLPKRRMTRRPWHFYSK